MEEQVNFNLENMTVGQAEFITDYTKRSLAEFMEVLDSSNLMGRDIIAVLAVIQNPEDPQAALPEVRQMKITDVSLDLG